MSVPIKPAPNPRWQKPSDEPVVDLTAAAAPAGEPAVEPDDLDDPIDEDVAKILTEIQSVTAVAELESRVAELEHELSRIRSGRSEDAGRVSNELATMKARIDDALGAVGATVAEIQAAAATPAEPVAPVVDGDALRDQVRAEIKPARDEVVTLAREEVAARVNQMAVDLDASLGTIRAEFQSSFTGLLQGLEAGLQSAREQTMREVERLREKIEPDLKAIRDGIGDETATLRRDLVSSEETFTGALRAFASRLEGLQAQLSEAGARQAAERAAAAAQVQAMSARVDMLEERMTEGLARLSEGILRIAENIGSASTLKRRLSALEEKTAGPPIPPA